MRTLLITGGSGFIGSALVRRVLAAGAWRVVNLDALTYAAHPDNLADVEADPRYRFVRCDLADPEATGDAFAEAAPDAVIHLAAESHVDRSIDGPAAFVRSNVTGTLNLLEAARVRREALDAASRAAFRVVHVSTDEVFGALGAEGRFGEASPYAPNSPYAATKAGADHLARAWATTYGLPVIVTNCSNNYGPRQFPEKLIPTVVLKAAAGEAIPVYGDGRQVRDWLHVDDHAAGLLAALERGRPGETYLFGGDAERENIAMVRAICDAVDRRRGGRARDRITFVADRPGHDRRYAVDASKAAAALDWRPTTTLADGLDAVVGWYLDNPGWVARARARGFDGARLGLGAAS